MITHKRGDQGITFPKILVCSHSMHSLERMEMAYPQVGKSILKLFYGSFEKIGGLEKDFWFNKILQGRFVETVKEMDINSQFGEYNKIDLNDFYKKTRPKYILKSCILNQIDCRNYWQFRRSLLGNCLMLDVSGIVSKTLKNINKISLGITFGENGSDITYGWNGGMAGYSLYHFHFTNTVEDHSSSILLTPSLTPIINLQNVEKIYKGLPYTKCKPTPYTNDYSYLNVPNREHIYTESFCVLNELMQKICRLCGCYLNYIDYIDDLKPENCSTPCDFFAHAVCASQLINTWEWSSHASASCEPPCNSFSFNHESIQYVRLTDSQAKAPLSFATLVLNLVEDSNIVLEETPTYGTSEFLSDVGGSAGLVLGLNLLSIVTCFTRIYHFIYKPFVGKKKINYNNIAGMLGNFQNPSQAAGVNNLAAGMPGMNMKVPGLGVLQFGMDDTLDSKLEATEKFDDRGIGIGIECSQTVYSTDKDYEFTNGRNTLMKF